MINKLPTWNFNTIKNKLNNSMLRPLKKTLTKLMLNSNKKSNLN